MVTATTVPLVDVLSMLARAMFRRSPLDDRHLILHQRRPPVGDYQWPFATSTLRQPHPLPLPSPPLPRPRHLQLDKVLLL